MVEFLASFAATLLMLPAVMKFLRWRNIVDTPNERSSHTKPVHRGGGLACLVGVAAGFGTAHLHGDYAVRWALVAIAIVLALVGLADDIGTLPAVPRLVAQLTAGGVSGWVVVHDIRWLLLGALVVTASVNVVNFMDGINGITGLTVAVWGVTAMMLAQSHGEPLFVIGAVTSAAALGFLPANLPTARLFLGDVGSYLLGGLIGIGILVGWHEGVAPITLVAPMAIYLADTGWTLTRRAIQRKPLLSAHREHVYQRLVSEAGLSHVVVASYATAFGATTALVWSTGVLALAVVVTVALILVYLSSAVWVAALMVALGRKQTSPHSTQ